MNVSEVPVRTNAYTLHVESTSAPQFIDITDKVEAVVEESGLRSGIVVVFSKHTTAAIVIQENEPLLLQDMESLLERNSPRNAHYRHNDFDVRTVHMHENECPNGHSHCQHLTLGTSETIPVINGKLAMGEFQCVFMVELDHVKALEVAYREVLVQTVGV